MTQFAARINELVRVAYEDDTLSLHEQISSGELLAAEIDIEVQRVRNLLAVAEALAESKRTVELAALLIQTKAARSVLNRHLQELYDERLHNSQQKRWGRSWQIAMFVDSWRNGQTLYDQQPVKDLIVKFDK